MRQLGEEWVGIARAARGRWAGRVLAWVLLAGGLAAVSSAHAQASPNVEGRARALEQRLHAPCCRDRMLEDHASESAQAMRSEIRTRFRDGQTELEIERAFRQRFGDSIVSVPLDRDPRKVLSSGLAVLLIASALLLVVLGIRWTRRSRAAASVSPGFATVDPLDERLDRELDKLE